MHTPLNQNSDSNSFISFNVSIDLNQNKNQLITRSKNFEFIIHPDLDFIELMKSYARVDL